MRHTRTWIRTAATALALLALVPAAHAQEASVRLRVLLPAGARLEIDGTPTSQTGPVRVFESPPVPVGKDYFYNLTATWTDGDRPVTRNKRVKVTAGREVEIDLRQDTEQTPQLDVPYVPTPQEVVEKMLDLAKVTDKDVVYDLGCGDGRIVITAAKKYGARGVGIDLNPQRVREARENARRAGVEDRVEFRQGNILRKIDDLDKATVVTLYLLPEVNLRLEPTLRKMLKPGTRIVSHDYDMGDWQPLQVAEQRDRTNRVHPLYLWRIEGEKAAADKPKADDVRRPANAESQPATNRAAVAEPKKEAPKKEADDEPKKIKEPDVIFVPTPQAVVDKMLELAEVKKGDVIYDLGCGDGRIVVTAAKKYGVKATGFDVDPQRIKESKANVKKNNVEDLAMIEQKDVFTLDLSKANVVTLYLLPELNVKLIPQLEKLKPGSRIVSHDFDMRGIKPKQVIMMKAKDDDGQEEEHTIYLWVTPLEKEKDK